ncbi:hypothetical protein EOI86_03545 [Hwanghaeella grinnelliae]|uniref:PEP-CTERM sorting domain-containing protein n=1 Tax=Hwanghaeella grinnelliae TaxID=2500179 RepID=A0A437QV46_9PROT|nr:choice-of-anchor L domain-containing protein [Hwanghaeella grinnelliae]RVU38375.1 hypothetical protein EOI86_03545 [Hwanghaeella grinnelliae]
MTRNSVEKYMPRIRGTLIVGALLALPAMPAHALSISTVDGNADAGLSLVNALLAPSSGITVQGGSTSFIGTSTQSGTFTDFSLPSSDPGEPTLNLPDGILLTTGVADIPLSNTDTGFSNETGTGSNTQLDAEFNGTPNYSDSNDQNVLSFSFTVDPGITSVSAELVFGSEEFSEFPSFTDAFAFFVDGTNFAVFPGGERILQSSGTQDEFNDNEDNSYGIEYDGLTDVLGVTGLLDLNVSVHTLTLIIADEGDTSLDSGVFLGGLTAGTEDDGGLGTPSEVPVPAAFPLLFTGLLGFGILKSRRKQMPA